MAAPLILTAALDPVTRERLDALRREHFPPERLRVGAHLTLFHHLPGDERERIEADVAAAAAGQPAITMEVDRVLALRAGVAFGMRAPALEALRARLAAAWDPWLTDQDRRRLRPHVTVQNKAEPEQARALHAELARAFEPWPARATGLELWEYRGGPWTAAGAFAFAER